MAYKNRKGMGKMMEQQQGLFSSEIEKQIALSLEIILKDVAEKSGKEPTKRYFKKKDFCKEIGISFNSCQLWITKGLPVVQVEGVLLIDMRDAEKFLQDHKI